MPRQETTLTVFVASPTDVSEERQRLQDVIDEINLIRARETGIRLELAKWETHAVPGFGSDAQDVINHTIPQDYDIFIGIMWQRFGTPTLRAASGTFEEFRSAKQRYDENPQSVRIMMYFKDAPIPPSRIDPDQLKLISEFRKTLGPEGALYWMFDDADNFEKYARIHLQRALQEWADKDVGSKAQLPEELGSVEPFSAEEEPGLLDLTIEFTERFSSAAAHMNSSTSLMELATSKLNSLTAEMMLLGATITPANMHRARSLTNSVATALNEFEKDFGRAATSASDDVEAGIDAMIKFVELQGTSQPEDEEALVELLQVMDVAQNSIAAYRGQIDSSAQGFEQWPPITKEVNKAKKVLVATLSTVSERQDQAIGLIKSLKQSLFSLINRRQ